MSWTRRAALRALPAVHRILALEDAEAAFAGIPDWLQTRAIRRALDDLRQVWGTETPTEEWWQDAIRPERVLERAAVIAGAWTSRHLKPVLNVTGTIIHTNLGRAPLSDGAVAAVASVAAGYSNLEYDLEQGVRGSRHTHVESLLCDLTGAESALVVNNNAAAAFIILRALAEGGEGIVSRGQLVEIGGSFRIPDIMAESGVRLVEVGSTNKTRVTDYEQALSEQTRVVLRVHTSNFRIIGFTEQPSLADLVELAHRRQIPVYEDLGSGALFDYAGSGIGDEPTVRRSVQCGVDVVSFSGDKLLGGAQAGIIVGKPEWLNRIRQHPLMRALRVDKMTLAALEATLHAHLDGASVRSEVPVVGMVTETYAEVATRCNAVYKQLQDVLCDVRGVKLELADDVSRIGGGALPEEALPTRVIRLTVQGWSAQALVDGLRRVPDVPVIARIAQDAVIFDVRTLLKGQAPLLIAQVQSLFAGQS